MAQIIVWLGVSSIHVRARFCGLWISYTVPSTHKFTLARARLALDSHSTRTRVDSTRTRFNSTRTRFDPTRTRNFTTRTRFYITRARLLVYLNRKILNRLPPNDKLRGRLPCAYACTCVEITVNSPHALSTWLKFRYRMIPAREFQPKHNEGRATPRCEGDVLLTEHTRNWI